MAPRSSRSCWARALVACAWGASPWCATGLWYPVDVPTLVCSGMAPVVVELTEEAVHENTSDESYHITFFRTVPREVQITLRVMDAKNRSVLNSTELTLGDADMLAVQAATARRLRGRGRGGRTGTAFGSFGFLRSRASVRPGSMPMYSSQKVFRATYGHSGNVHSVPYGYTGYATNFWTGGRSGTRSATGGLVAVALGGVAFVAASNVAAHGLSGMTSDSMCTHKSQTMASTWEGTCDECVDHFPIRQCHQEKQMDEPIVRDDILSVTFVPHDYTFPLRAYVSQVSSTSLAAHRICPPKGWNGTHSSVQWSMPDKQDVYLSLSQTVGMDTSWQAKMTPNEHDAGVTAATWSVLFVFMFVLAGCIIFNVYILYTKGAFRSEEEEEDNARPRVGYTSVSQE